MIIELGGKIENNSSKVKVTHFLISKNRKFNFEDDRKLKNFRNYFVVNLKFIFHSFYYLEKLDENDKEYSNLFE
jgi:hypothetical protein